MEAMGHVDKELKKINTKLQVDNKMLREKLVNQEQRYAQLKGQYSRMDRRYLDLKEAMYKTLKEF